MVDDDLNQSQKSSFSFDQSISDDDEDMPNGKSVNSMQPTDMDNQQMSGTSNNENRLNKITVKRQLTMDTKYTR